MFGSVGGSMSTNTAILSPEMPSEVRKAALLNLLTDEDAAVYQLVRERIIAHGPAAVDWLRPHTLSNDASLRRRAREIIRHFARQSADDQFVGFCLRQGEDLDLEQGVWLLAQTEYPDCKPEAYEALFDSYAGELRERLDRRAGAEHILGVLNDYVFGVLGFRGNEEHYYDPENSYLNRVVDRRKGNPISLCLVYLLLARRLGLPVTGIGLPGHFICRFQSSAAELYVDVFNGGQIWTKANCIQYLLYGNYALEDDYLAPLSPRRLLTRVCHNLHQIYRQAERPEEITRLQRYLTALGS